jgi:hypothetical protein
VLMMPYVNAYVNLYWTGFLKILFMLIDFCLNNNHNMMRDSMAVILMSHQRILYKSSLVIHD